VSGLHSATFPCAESFLPRRDNFDFTATHPGIADGRCWHPYSRCGVRLVTESNRWRKQPVRTN
uniref:Uncharacterized protein n=1 Tax=Haemonchus contortus TaxID=6289 RepID=A0A7I4YPE2_HAECO